MKPSRSTNRERGQILPLVALMALVVFAFGALAFDGGLAFSDRRNDQNVVDNAALAGAQDLSSGASTANQTSALNDAVQFFKNGISRTSAPCAAPTGTITARATVNGAGETVTCTVGRYDFTATTPLTTTPTPPYDSTDAKHMVETWLTHHNTPSLMSAAGLGAALDIGAHAVAVGGTPVASHPHAVWSTFCKGSGCNGGGNTLALDGPKNGPGAEVDEGNGGTPCNDYTTDLFSDTKIHVNDPKDTLDVNGGINLTNGDSESNKLYQYWTTRPASINNGAAIDLSPGYKAPSSVAATYDVTVYKNGPDPTPSVSGTALTLFPGHYTKDVTVTGSSVVTNGKSYTGITDVVLTNGVYFFDGANFIVDTTTAELHSEDYAQNLLGVWVASSRTPTNVGADQETDGVEFYMFGSSQYWVKQGTVSVQAPAHIIRTIGGTNEISVYVDMGNTGDTKQGVKNFIGSAGLQIPLAIGTDQTTTGLQAYPSGSYHEQGVIYVQNASDNQTSLGIFLAATSTDLLRYTAEGQVIAPYVGVNTGGVVGASTPLSCQADSTSATQAGKLVQYASKFVPTITFSSSGGLVA